MTPLLVEQQIRIIYVCPSLAYHNMGLTSLEEGVDNRKSHCCSKNSTKTSKYRSPQHNKTLTSLRNTPPPPHFPPLPPGP